MWLHSTGHPRADRPSATSSPGPPSATAS